MVDVQIRTRDGLPTHLSSRGHAGGNGSASNAACAAVSVLLKSFGLALVQHHGCTVDLAADQPGEFDLHLLDWNDPAWMQGVWTVTKAGLRETESAWPQEVQITITEEKKDGT